ncbi:unnamed protein product [Closterium sp. NIES-53]
MLALCCDQRLEHITKHIALRYFLARELQQRRQIRLSYVASRANTADVFTKALGSGDHQPTIRRNSSTSFPCASNTFTTVTGKHPDGRPWAPHHPHPRKMALHDPDPDGICRDCHTPTASTSAIVSRGLAPIAEAEQVALPEEGMSNPELKIAMRGVFGMEEHPLPGPASQHLQGMLRGTDVGTFDAHHVPRPYTKEKLIEIYPHWRDPTVKLTGAASGGETSGWGTSGEGWGTSREDQRGGEEEEPEPPVVPLGRPPCRPAPALPPPDIQPHHDPWDTINWGNEPSTPRRTVYGPDPEPCEPTFVCGTIPGTNISYSIICDRDFLALMLTTANDDEEEEEAVDAAAAEAAPVPEEDPEVVRALYMRTSGFRADDALWHQRLGHPSRLTLNNRIEAGVFAPGALLRPDGTELRGATYPRNCTVWPEAALSHQPFPLLEPGTNRYPKLHKVYSDFLNMGHYGINDELYMLTFVDAGTCYVRIMEARNKAYEVHQPFPLLEPGTNRYPKLHKVYIDFLNVGHYGINDELYTLTFVDAGTCYVRIMEARSRAYKVFRLWLAHAQQQSGEKLKIWQSDDAAEFRSKQLQDYLAQKGIEHHISLPYTHQQQGIAEKMNRKLMTKVQALMKQSKRLPTYWTYAMHHAMRVLNLLSTTAITGNSSPHVKWPGTKGYTSMLRMGGCMVHYRPPTSTIGKFTSCARWGIHLGISHEHNILDLMSQKVTNAHYVIFYERLFLKQFFEDEQTNTNSVYANDGHIYATPEDEAAAAIMEQDTRGKFTRGDRHSSDNDNDDDSPRAGVGPAGGSRSSRGAAPPEPESDNDDRHGIDFDQTFAPVSRHTSVRILLAIAAARHLPLRQIDVKNALLYALVDAVIYVEQPQTRPTPTPPCCAAPPGAEPRRPAELRRPTETRRPAEPHGPARAAPAASAATAATTATAAIAEMASPNVLTFDAEGRAVDFDVWVDDLQLFLQCDSKDRVSPFDHTSGVSPAPAATADSTVRSQWTTRDAVARLAVRSHLPSAERAHFGQYKTATPPLPLLPSAASCCRTCSLNLPPLPQSLTSLLTSALVMLATTLRFPLRTTFSPFAPLSSPSTC